MAYGVVQFRYGESDVTKKQRVSVSNEFRQETGCAQLNLSVGYGAIVMSNRSAQNSTFTASGDLLRAMEMTLHN